MLKTLKILGLLCAFAGWAAAQAPSELPRVMIIATGGTIAGEQGEPGTLGGYDIRKPIGEIISEVPEIKKYARIETVQFANVPSAYITPSQWLQLARRINNVFKEDPALAGEEDISAEGILCQPLGDQGAQAVEAFAHVRRLPVRIDRHAAARPSHRNRATNRAAVSRSSPSTRTPSTVRV